MRRERRADGDLRQIDRRHAIDAEAEVAGGADHDQREDDHRREDRPLDRNFPPVSAFTWRGRLAHAL
jgi:hypothetical protein